ncbi:MAG: DeoR/GlpR family DNA-binding transcription regulator [Sphaerochaeta sp.]|uniref:DeoR/GlpR family DNA-binding transcription regulator n=1 Tax=uncultured Sphaerochaeta sp. TaxID=886478 RepID=UPI002A0A755B|nr:DeoR/GlpR family DNA-binding transcription regulator [uncultured Sphaerochaeta sp.]MDD4302741.1 DeoR/GlpR family DNA-binding transcription regulator [Sphaerochaeta sp.]MDY0243695.1 DeoR/GlpR family DNA-binding transcription regulator [Sphaerochaeta sp.]
MHKKIRKNNKMLANERRNKILEFIQEDGSARVKTLSEMFHVSEPTIRQDLEVLEKDGHIVREHGGAFLKTMSRQVSTLTLQHTEHLDEKRKIAEKALEFIKDGDSLILDSGSTVTELAAILHQKKNLTVLTNALNIALLVGSNPNFQLMVSGGEFKPPTLSLTGLKAASFFETAFVDKLFLASGGVAQSLDLTYPSFNDLVVKRAMINSAHETYLLVDSSKFGKTSIASLGNLSQIDYIITDAGIAAEYEKRILDLGVKLIKV